MEKQQHKVIVVDEQDNIIGAEHMFDAIEQGLIRRVARVYVFNEKGELLIQQRSANVLMPLQLDQSAAGHVDEGETYREAAERELAEELGITNVPLEEIETSLFTPGFFNGIYRIIVPAEQTINFDQAEVAAVFWYTIDQIEQEMQTEPDKFTQPFHVVWPLIRDKIIPS